MYSTIGYLCLLLPLHMDFIRCTINTNCEAANDICLYQTNYNTLNRVNFKTSSKNIQQARNVIFVIFCDHEAYK